MEASLLTLLVVDDSPENREVLSRRLQKKGFAVREAEDGPRALEILAREAIDLVLLDIMMPGMNGIEVLKILRQTRPASELPVIMATARSESDDIVEALELGANDYITKPLDFPVVLARVNAQLRARKPAAAEPTLDPADIKSGTVLAGKYRLDRRIGSGSFGTVWRARHLDLEHDVALKVLQVSVADRGEPLARFRREGISACRVKHPNAVTILDFSIEGGAAFLVMELLEGHSLHDELTRHGALVPARAAGILLPVCEALAEAHGVGIVHRDIKPSNIFLQQTPRGEVPKVLDFGIAKIVGGESDKAVQTLSGTILGTLSYMAPERFRGLPADGKADVYSLGVTLYEMLCGRPPFVMGEKKSPMAMAAMHVNDAPRSLCEVAPDVSAALDAVVMQALRKDPAQRPTIEELGHNLARATAGAVAGAGDPKRPEPRAAGRASASSATLVTPPRPGTAPTEVERFTPVDEGLPEPDPKDEEG